MALHGWLKILQYICVLYFLILTKSSAAMAEMQPKPWQDLHHVLQMLCLSQTSQISHDSHMTISETGKGTKKCLPGKETVSEFMMFICPVRGINLLNKLRETLVKDNSSCAGNNKGWLIRWQHQNKAQCIGVIMKPMKHMLQHMVRRDQDLICCQPV